MRSSERMARLVRRIGQAACGIWPGHYRVLKFEENRLALVCTECDHETPGWGDLRPRREEPA